MKTIIGSNKPKSGVFTLQLYIHAQYITDTALVVQQLHTIDRPTLLKQPHLTEIGSSNGFYLIHSTNGDSYHIVTDNAFNYEDIPNELLLMLNQIVALKQF